jgi:hypothetical protein
VGLASRLVFAEDVRVKVTSLVGLGVDAIDNGSDAPLEAFSVACVWVVRCKIRGSQVQLRNVVHSTPGDQSSTANCSQRRTHTLAELGQRCTQVMLCCVGLNPK